jgi:uncharacterized repeat protein (TIGR02543 family)
MKKTVFCVLLAMVLAFGFIGCGSMDNECTVTFDLDGGNIDGNTDPVKITVQSGETIAHLPPDPQKNNDTFGGWFSSKNGLGNEFTSATTVTSNRTVYAKWTAIELSPFEGSWKGWTGDGEAGGTVMIYQFTGNNFLVTMAGNNNAKGTFSYTPTELTITLSHIWNGSQWLSEWTSDFGPTPFIQTVNYTISDNTLTFIAVGPTGNDLSYVKQ